MKIHRGVFIIVENLVEPELHFANAVSDALYEYADAVKKDQCGKNACEKFTASNGCSIKVIAGANAINQ